jgi:YVTN family beta-propeller protein
VGRLPEGIATDARTDTIYVTNSFISNNKPRTVSVISGSTNAVTATVPVGIEPIGVATDPLTNSVYVADTRAARRRS